MPIILFIPMAPAWNITVNQKAADPIIISRLNFSITGNLTPNRRGGILFSDAGMHAHIARKGEKNFEQIHYNSGGSGEVDRRRELTSTSWVSSFWFASVFWSSFSVTLVRVTRRMNFSCSLHLSMAWWKESTSAQVFSPNGWTLAKVNARLPIPWTLMASRNSFSSFVS